ncbi:MAG: hypothetical protein MUE98_13600 [Rhodobacteraceae bacterium]|jgi:hypothetical protein|nr:hypothetical protein [Paracoccaceae bacterium]
MQQMIAPFRTDVEPVGAWRPPLPSHRLFAPDLSDRQAPARRTAPPVLVLPKAARLATAEAVARVSAEVSRAAAPRRSLRRLTQSVLMFLERSRCPG